MSKTGEVVVEEMNKEMEFREDRYCPDCLKLLVKRSTPKNYYVCKNCGNGYFIVALTLNEREEKLKLICSTREPEVDNNSADVCGGNPAEKEGEELC